MLPIIRNNLKISSLLRISNNAPTMYGNQYHQENYPQTMTNQRPGAVSHRKHPYLAMYPWKNFQEFVDRIYESIIYEDEYIVAIEKPWGVGTWSAPLSVHKTNAHLLQMEYFGTPHFCLADAMPDLEFRLRTNSLKVCKSIDRFQSGVVLLCKNQEGAEKVRKAGRRARAMGQPFMTFWCICRGYPVTSKSDKKIERVGIRLLEVDELGDYKEPVILSEFTTSQMKREEDFKVVRADCRVLDSNSKLSASLIEISCDTTKWRFIQAYAAFRTSFILGDVRFSRRVGQLLGNPTTLVPQKINSPGYSDYEPLHSKVRKQLKVARNSEIPLMIHHKKIILPMYRWKERESLKIESRMLPPHFEWTAKSLGLISLSPNDSEE